MKIHPVGQSNNKMFTGVSCGGSNGKHCCAYTPRDCVFPRACGQPCSERSRPQSWIEQKSRVPASVTCYSHTDSESRSTFRCRSVCDRSEMDKEQNNEESTTLQSHEFYTDAAKYWENIPATVDGMLGGFGFISHTDIEGSQLFLKSLFKLKDPPQKTYALDCGSGIGRITKNLLTKHFKHVDLVEQCSKFLDEAKVSLSCCSSKIGEFYPLGLQDFCPTTKKYDVIWCQWVLGHLKDDDLINFFKKCIPALRDNGILVVKENVTSSNTLEIDTQDSSMTRPLAELKASFDEAGLICIKEQLQHRLPKGLYPVYMFALRPAKLPSTSQTNDNDEQ